MKALEWHRYLHEQRRRFGKVVFAVSELSNVSGSSLRTLNVTLGRLQKQGVIVRYAQGLYGLPNAVTPAQLLPYLDSAAYITAASALSALNLITQIPSEIVCFTNRRSGRPRVRVTPVGRFVFVHVPASVYARPKRGELVGYAQAVCDYAFLMRRRGVDPLDQVTFRNLDRIDKAEMERHLLRYPASTRKSVMKICAANAQSA